MADFVEICNVCARKAIIVAAKRIILRRCAIVSDLNFGVTFFGTQCRDLLKTFEGRTLSNSNSNFVTSLTVYVCVYMHICVLLY